MGEPTSPSGERSPGRLDFFPSPLRADPRDLEAHRAGLGAAVRVAHALAIDWGIRWESGPRGRVSLVTRSARAARWAQETFAATYPGGRWRAQADTWLDVTPLGWVTRPTDVVAAVPMHDGREGWSEGFVDGLRLLPSGLRVEWQFAAMNARPQRRGDASLRPLPRGYAWEPRSREDERLEDERAASASAWRWAMHGQLVRTRAWNGPVPVAEVAALIERTSLRPGAGALRLNRRSRWRVPGSEWWVAGENELLGLLPSPNSSIGSAAGPTEPGGARLWIGPEGARDAPSWPIAATTGRHALILGETGMGKSSLLVRLGLEAIRQGSVVLFDPIGDVAAAFLDRLPRHPKPRTVWISPEHSPLGMNALGTDSGSGDPTSNERRIAEVVHALRRVRALRFGEATFWGPRIEEIATLALRCAAATPKGTIGTALDLLDRDDARAVVPEVVQPWWRPLRRRIEDRPEEADGARRLLGDVALHPVLRQMVCDPQGAWSWGESLRESTVTIVSGDAPFTGESCARYLLAVHLALLWAAIVSERDRPKLFVLLDEAQGYAHESAAEMLRMGRRFNVHVLLATQSLDSLAGAVRESALTNCSDLAVFRGAPSDARELAHWSPRAVPEEILSLGRGEALVFTGKGERLQRTVVPRLPPIPAGGVGWGRASGPRGKVDAGPSSGANGPTDPNSAPTGPRRVGVPDEARRQIRMALAVGAALTDSGGGLRVRLHRLREVCDPSGEAVRAVGDELRQAQLLLRTERTTDGSIWWLDADAVRVHPEFRLARKEIATVEALWRRIAGPTGPSDAKGSLGGAPPR